MVPVVVLRILTKEVALDMVGMVLEVIRVAVGDMMVQVLDKAVILKFIILTRPVIHRDLVVVEDLEVMVQLLAWVLDLPHHNQIQWRPNLTV